MRPDQSSTTAENNAALRALEYKRPVGERICNDPFAKFFLSDSLFQAEDTFSLLNQLMSGWERVFPGVCGAIIARTRFIDDCLVEVIEEGLEQVVILGAGYDTRVLRFARLQENINVFELDHPTTQAVKLERYRKNLQVIPDHVVFVPVNFDEDELDLKLFKNGYDRLLKTIFIWEGITYYISPSAVESTLVFISDNSPAGSSVVFDYFSPSVADGTCHLREARALREALKQLGEEFVFGIDPVEIRTYLSKRGFDLVKNLSAKECKRDYFKGPNRYRAVSEMFTFAHARVKRS